MYRLKSIMRHEQKSGGLSLLIFHLHGIKGEMEKLADVLVFPSHFAFSGEWQLNVGIDNH